MLARSTATGQPFYVAYHVPRPEDNGPRPHMTTSAASCGVESISAGLEVLHAVLDRGEIHLGTVVVVEISRPDRQPPPPRMC